MFAMQYGFDLHESFDMNAIRLRVAEIGSRFDQLPGLYLKAFLLADRAHGHANRYAPFYLWQDEAGMTSFLLSDAFRAVAAKYGRPAVHCWSPIGFLHGAAVQAVPRFARHQVIDVGAGTDLADVSRAEHERLQGLAGHEALHTAFVGLDANAWQLVRISLWHTAPAASGHAAEGAEGERVFEVLHLSAPGLPAAARPEALA